MNKAKEAAQVKVPGSKATFGEVLRAVLTAPATKRKPKKKAAKRRK